MLILIKWKIRVIVLITQTLMILNFRIFAHVISLKQLKSMEIFSRDWIDKSL